MAYVGMGVTPPSNHSAPRASEQQLTTGSGPSVSMPTMCGQVEWWEHTGFAGRVELEAAEFVAFDRYDRTLASV